MNLITDLNPYFEKPYTIGQLLIPSNGWINTSFDPEKQNQDIKDAVALWLKWIKNFCDTQKVQAIINEPDLNQVINNPKYANPCKGYKIPYYLGYIYFFYLNENLNASDYYKVVSAQDDAPRWARTLAAIMQWKWGDREKSLYMFLSLAGATAKWEDEACSILSNELQKVYTWIKSRSLPIEWWLISEIENLSKQVLPKLSEENERNLLADSQCTNFLAKGIRELNLMYIEEADAQYIRDNPSEVSARDVQTLFETWYIDFIPTDYQQYPDWWYGIVYRYKSDIWRFDYEIANYE